MSSSKQQDLNAMLPCETGDAVSETGKHVVAPQSAGRGPGGLQHKITCIVATSATMLAPAVQYEMLRHTVQSVTKHAGDIPIIVVCDGHKPPQEGRGQDKRGNLGPEQALSYKEYKTLLLGDPSFRTHVLTEHMGFGHAIAEAAKASCETPFLLVAQHDFMFTRSVCVHTVLTALESGAARYVVFPCGKRMVEQAKKLSKDFRVEGLEFSREDASDCAPVTLLPFAAYHDKNHVIARDVFLQDVIPYVKRGQFPEDVFSQKCQRRSGRLWHRMFGIFLYHDPTHVRGCLAHLRGRQCRTPVDMMRNVNLALADHDPESSTGSSYESDDDKAVAAEVDAAASDLAACGIDDSGHQCSNKPTM